MDEDLFVENSLLMDLVQHDQHLHRGLVQRNLTRMANKPDRTVVQFRNLPETRRKKKKNLTDDTRRKKKKKLLNRDDKVFTLEFGYRDPYTAVVGRVANKLHVDQTRIRLSRHACWLNQPSGTLITSQSTGCLLDLLLTSNKICNVLYYKVLHHPKVQHLKTVEVADYPHAKQIPEENKLDRDHHVLQLYHFTKTKGGEESRKPFIVAVRDDETLAEVKVRLQSKLAIETEEFSKWKFALSRSGGPPVYLEDTDVICGRFEGKGDFSEQYLGFDGQPSGTIDADILQPLGNLEGASSFPVTYIEK